ncbi:Flp family type IVb pilin [Streptomyces sp. ISL-90]|nr:Flp family type IVb pilin [Streptomyces sp. ISL-90]
MFKVYARTEALLNSLREKEEGATAVEYALIVGLVSLIIIGALALIGPAVVSFVNTDIIPKL